MPFDRLKRRDGLCDEWKNREIGERIKSHAIIITKAERLQSV
jgi:hypothetical protein